MRWLMNLVTSSIGAKLLMALTGALLVVFLVGHFVGNLQVFAGQDAINDYAVFLHARPGVLWVVRSALIVAYLAHVVSSLRLTYLNRLARPVPYTRKQALVSSLASRNMLVTGLFIFTFVAFHLAHFTFKANPRYRTLVDAAGRPDVFTMMVEAFSDPLVSGLYIAAMLLLGLHLWHSISSIFQTTGVADARHNRTLQAGSLGLAIIITAGFLAIPVGILLGLAPEVH